MCQAILFLIKENKVLTWWYGSGIVGVLEWYSEGTQRALEQNEKGGEVVTDKDEDNKVRKVFHLMSDTNDYVERQSKELGLSRGQIIDKLVREKKKRGK